MKDRKHYYEYQSNLVNKIMDLLDRKIDEKDKELRMSSYIQYLESNSSLKRSRIKSILENQPHTLISIKEFIEIAYALEVQLYELFKVD